MKIPKVTSLLNRIAKYLHGYYSGWFNKTVIHLTVVVPPSLILALYSNKSLKNFIKVISTDATYQQIATIGRDYSLVFNAISFIWPIVLLTLGSEIVKRAESDGLSVDGLLALIASLDRIVGTKNTRFSQHVKNINHLSKETVFENITDPKAQIVEILREICAFFNATRSEKKRALIRVTLAIFKDGKICELPVFFPSDEPIKSSIESLNSRNSAFLTAYNSKKMVLISDIQKELKKAIEKRKFAETENEEDNSGSVICYPVKVQDSSVPFVISIHCDEAGYFKDEFKELYEHSLQRFALRLSVENSLLVMKEKFCVNKN